MTQPSVMLDAIAGRLAAALAPLAAGPDTPAVEVQALDDLNDDVSEYTTFGVPAVLISCAQMPLVQRDSGPLVIDATWFARCYARLPAHPNTRGDVAMDLAALVGSIVEEEFWLDGEGKKTAYARASRITIRSRATPALRVKGHSMWLVGWQQQLELTPVDQSALLHSFKTLHFDVAMGDADTTDVAATIALEGGQVP